MNFRIWTYRIMNQFPFMISLFKPQFLIPKWLRVERSKTIYSAHNACCTPQINVSRVSEDAPLLFFRIQNECTYLLAKYLIRAKMWVICNDAPVTELFVIRLVMTPNREIPTCDEFFKLLSMFVSKTKSPNFDKYVDEYFFSGHFGSYF